MKRWVLDILCCPECKGNLTPTVLQENDADIVEGYLTCESCKAVYPISAGTPDLTPKHRR